MANKTLAVGMTTAARKERYVFDSIASFRAAGFEEPLHVFAEPKSHDLSELDNLVVNQHTKQLGCFPNWKFSLSWLTKHVDADWYLIVQDDVIYRDDTAFQLHKGIDAQALQNVGFLSPYTSTAMVHPSHRSKKGWWPAFHGRKKGFWGALALCMPRASALRLLNNQRFKAHSHHRKVDVIVGNVFRDLHLDRRVCLPSLCDHIGKVSTLGRHKIRGISHGRKGFRFRKRV